MLAPGDVNLTFKRYLECAVHLTIEKDFVTRITGEGLDAALMSSYFEAWGDRNAYAVSHAGWGMNKAARWEALAMYDKRRHQRHGAARLRRQFPLFDRRQRDGGAAHARAFRSAAAPLHDPARQHADRGTRRAAGRAGVSLPRYREAGRGARTLVFLHGVGTDAESWELQLAEFGQHYRAIAWNMPGYGGSAPLAIPSFAGMADALRDLLDELAVPRVDLIGHSYGGMVAQEFAARHPSRLRTPTSPGTQPVFRQAR